MLVLCLLTSLSGLKPGKPCEPPGLGLPEIGSIGAKCVWGLRWVSIGLPSVS